MTNKKDTTLVHIVTVPLALRFFAGQIGYMQAQGLTLHVLSSPGELLDAFAEKYRVTAHAVEMQRRITPFKDLLAILHIFRRLRAIRPSIVHAHTPKGGLLGMIAAWLARVPVRIYHIHGLPLITATGYKRVLLYLTEKVSCLLAHQVLCVSHSVREEAVAASLCPSEKINVLLQGSINGVDAQERFNPQLAGVHRAAIREAFGIPADALVIGYVGRIVRDKGIVELVSAWQVLRDALPQVHMLVVGPFEDQDPIPDETAGMLTTDERIHVTGLISDLEDMPAYFAAMDVVALPTYREGFPVVPLEAAAMGLPVVTTGIPGCIDAVVDTVTGTLIQPRDVPALEQALHRYLTDEDLRHQHGDAGRQRALKDFAPERIWEAQYQEYARLLQSKQ